MGKSRSNANFVQPPQPSATERLQRALSRPVNEAINIPEAPAKKATEVKAVPTPGLLGSGMAAKAARTPRQKALDSE